MTQPRFKVSSVTGYAINQGSLAAGHSRPIPTSFTVLDTAVCYRIMASFPAGSSRAGYAKRLQAAEALAARLNAEDQAHK